MGYFRNSAVLVVITFEVLDYQLVKRSGWGILDTFKKSSRDRHSEEASWVPSNFEMSCLIPMWRVWGEKTQNLITSIIYTYKDKFVLESSVLSINKIFLLVFVLFSGTETFWNVRKSMYCVIQNFTWEFLTILESPFPTWEPLLGTWITYRPWLSMFTFIHAVFTLSYTEGECMNPSLLYSFTLIISFRI